MTAETASTLPVASVLTLAGGEDCVGLTVPTASRLDGALKLAPCVDFNVGESSGRSLKAAKI
ncbi:MAG: hypothetical protein IJO06_05855 [Thermoguttaceae bacterium]|nr:hypothetical protein [Thermoguttaceae bacterium]